MFFIGFRTGFLRLITLCLLALSIQSCDKYDHLTPPTGDYIEPPKETTIEGLDYFWPKIDLGNWKETLTVGNPTKVSPPEILDYANNDVLLATKKINSYTSVSIQPLDLARASRVVSKTEV